MKKVLVMVALVMASVIVYAFNDSRETNQGKKEVTGNGSIMRNQRSGIIKVISPPSSTYMQIGADHVAKQLLS